MITLLFIIGLFVLGFIVLVIIYNKKTNNLSSKHHKEQIKEIEESFKRGEISKDDYIDLIEKL
jgi:uncharacterized membrane protein